MTVLLAREVKVQKMQGYAQHTSPGKGEVYRHYKGDLYVVLGRCLKENDLVDMVVYQNLSSGYVWCRPVTEWSEKVQDMPEPTGPLPVLEPRFVLQDHRLSL